MKRYLLLLPFIISSSMYPISKTDRFIIGASAVTGALIGSMVSLNATVNIQQDLIPFIAAVGGVTVGTFSGIYASKAYLKRKYGVSKRVFDIALQFDYDLTTKQKFILQAAEQKNNTVLKKYVEELLEQQFGENGPQKFISLMHEYQLIAKKNKRLREKYTLFKEKVGQDTTNLFLTVLSMGILPIAILYFDADWAGNILLVRSIFELEKQIKLAQDFMEAIGFTEE